MKALAIVQQPAEPTPTLSKMIRDSWTGDLDGTADAVCKMLELSDRQTLLLRPLIRHHVATRHNGGSRAAWKAMSGTATAGDHARYRNAPGATSVDLTTDARLTFLARHCSLPNGEWVLNGEMTPAQHELRIKMISTTRDAVDREIQMRRSWIAQIQRTKGAKCLNDVYGRAAP